MSDLLAAAREAVRRHAWEEAREAFTSAEDEKPLVPADLESLANSCWWSGSPEAAVDALERAYAGFVETGDNDEAARLGVFLGYLAFRRGAFAVGSGWMAKAERLLEDEPEGRGHAWLQLMRMQGELMAGGDAETAIANSDRAIELARKYGVEEIQAMALSFKGYAKMLHGDWREGIALVDEANAVAVAGDLDPHIACGVYCNTIAVCRNLADYRRAGEWTEEAERWMQRHSLGGYPGVCRVHRAELKKLQGAYPEAEQEARAACEELERFHLLDSVGLAHSEIGEVRLRMGDLEAAEQSFRRAYEYGWHAQPGMALLMLGRGDVDGALQAISAPLVEGVPGEVPGDRLRRALLLPAQVKIALYADDPETAENATEELEKIAADFEQPALEAKALTARGQVEFHADHPEKAIVVLDRAWRLWQEIDLPYESAQARVLLGRAKASAGDENTARMELNAARSALQRLGATVDLKEVDELLGEDAVTHAGEGHHITKTFMFTDIVTSTDLIGLIGDDAWEDLLRWHDRALRYEFSKHGGHEVRHTGDGFFVAFDSASDAVNGAVAIQRRLRKHRRDQGFSPWVRIGLHTAEAIRQGSDYAGGGVHVASRVGDMGGRDEIVISTDALEAAGSIAYPASEPRTVEAKGINEPVEIHTIDWR
jgi:class 3 adenylate cyclase